MAEENNHILRTARKRYRAPEVGALGMTAALMLAGCGGNGGEEGGGENVVGSIETSDGDTVENAEEFLEDVSSDWRETLPEENVEIADEAGCFFVLDGDEAVTDELACGGYRLAGAEADEGWDVGQLQIRENSDNEFHAQLASEGFADMDIGTARPSGDVVDASGDAAPESLDDLDAPEMPTAESGITVVDHEALDSLETSEDIDVSEGLIRTTAGDLEITSISTVEELPLEGDVERNLGGDGSESEFDEDDTDGTEDTDDTEAYGTDQDGTSDVAFGELPHAAAEGETFYLVDATFEPAESSPDVSPSVTLNTGGQQAELFTLDGGDGWGQPESEDYTFLVSAQADDGDHLQISADGHDQGFNLAAGERGDAGVAATYYRDVTQQDLQHEYSFADQDVALTDGEDEFDAEISFDTHLMEAQIVPYSAEQGWADEGNMWLAVDFYSSLEADSWTWSLEEAEFSVSVDHGADTASSSDSEVITREGTSEEFLMMLQVPADATSFTITPSLSAELSPSGSPLSQTVEFTTDGYEVEFPHDGETEDSAEEEEDSDEPEDAEEGDEPEDEQDESEEGEDS